MHYSNEIVSPGHASESSHTDSIGLPYHELIDGSTLTYYTSDGHTVKCLVTQQDVDNMNAVIHGKEVERRG